MSDSPKSKKSQALIQLALFAGIVILLNILVNVRIGGRGLYANIDLTEEKRFTLSPATKAVLEELELASVNKEGREKVDLLFGSIVVLQARAMHEIKQERSKYI